MHWLYNNLYHPAAFTERLSSFIAKFETQLPSGTQAPSPAQMPPPSRPIENDLMGLIVKLASLGPQEARMCSDVAKLATRKPQLMILLKSVLAQYAQIRYMSEKGSYWNPQLSQPGADSTTFNSGGAVRIA
jgi:Lon protease-like protein